jgi:hypothetical protein
MASPFSKGARFSVQRKTRERASSPCGVLAGEALGAVTWASLVVAVVMTSPALEGGGVVHTSDVDDFRRRQRHFPTGLVLPV